jgi:hypothetical protein
LRISCTEGLLWSCPWPLFGDRISLSTLWCKLEHTNRGITDELWCAIVTVLCAKRTHVKRLVYFCHINRGSIPGKGNDWIFSLPRPDRFWGPPRLLTNGYLGALSPWVKCPGRECDHSSPSSAKVKNAWSCTSTHPYISITWCLIKHRDTSS